ncbi:MAG: carbohydrate ABC transporter substrate-binding protein [Clostridium sp.]|uniref:carbohydrate ABC transporter substrate-binding protein n=1 Tax=Clostridium sp. TaxID=1506 RepID=UPI002FCC0B75
MKKRHIKILTLLAATTVGLSLFAGCGNKTEETNAGAGEQKELNVAVFEGGFGKEYWEEVAKRFEKDNPGVKVNLECSPKIGDIIRPKIASGGAPDFVYLKTGDPSGLTEALIKDEALTDISDVFDMKLSDGTVLKEKMMDGFLDNSLTSPYGDGKKYLAPLYYNLTGMWYNKTYFEEKGLKEPKTWDEFYALNDAAKKDGKALFTYQGMSPGYTEAMLYPAIASAGGEDALKDILNYKEGAWKTDAAKSALGVFETIAKKGYLMNGTVAMNHTQAQTEFLNGKALFIPNGNWFEGEMKDAIPEKGFSFGFMAPPVFKEGQDRYVTTMIEQMYIPKDAKNADLAKKFLLYQYEDENIKLNAEKSGGVIPTKNGLELAKEFLPKSNYESFKVFNEGVKPITLSFATTGQTEVNIKDEIFNPISSVMNGKLTVEKWVEQLEKSDTKLREAMK